MHTQRERERERERSKLSAVLSKGKQDFLFIVFLFSRSSCGFPLLTVDFFL